MYSLVKTAISHNGRHKSLQQENYRAGLLHFHQFCDMRKIPESLHMPAPDHLLAAFIASWAGKVAGSTVPKNWLAGIHFWHNIHSAPWHGSTLVYTATSGLCKVVPQTSKKLQRPPVTLEHMHTLFHLLDLSNSFNMSVFAIAATAFWSCCRYNIARVCSLCQTPNIYFTRLGELLINSVNSFDASHHVSHSAPLCHGRYKRKILAEHVQRSSMFSPRASDEARAQKESESDANRANSNSWTAGRKWGI
ncbi:hypothetical protein EV424DRAFT_1337830 [Suillus variegatus]|nr:hypothetical protein EV424DRAFT_1337830 [Suillus variegatus]